MEERDRPIGIVYEHPLWFEPLFAELDRRGVAYERVHAGELVFDPGAAASPYSLVVNRMSPSAGARGHGGAISHVLQYLTHLETIGVPVINGRAAFEVEISKARQCGIFADLGLRYPATRVIGHPSQAVAAAREIGFPVLVKPNVGGSGTGIRSFSEPEELGEAAAGGLDLGLDGTALVQEHLEADEESIVRVEILDGELLYAIRIRLVPGGFNLCPADYCELPGTADGVSGRGLPIEPFDPPTAIVDDARRILAAARMDLGGVEYLVGARDGRPYYYDVNALSNFVADAPRIVGFDPFVDLVDFVLAGARAGAGRSPAPA